MRYNVYRLFEGELKLAGRNESPQDIKNKKILAENLKKFSYQKNVKQVDVSKATGISLSTLNGYYNAQRLPSPGTVQKLADFFNIKKSDLDPRFRNIGLNENAIVYNESQSDTPTSLQDAAEQYAKNFRSFNNINISDEQIEAIKEITLGYLKSQGISDKDDKKD